MCTSRQIVLSKDVVFTYYDDCCLVSRILPQRGYNLMHHAACTLPYKYLVNRKESSIRLQAPIIYQARSTSIVILFTGRSYTSELWSYDRIDDHVAASFMATLLPNLVRVTSWRWRLQLQYRLRTAHSVRCSHEMCVNNHCLNYLISGINWLLDREQQGFSKRRINQVRRFGN